MKTTPSPNQIPMDFNITLPPVQPAFRAHSETSKAAAEKIKRDITARHHTVIRHLFKNPNISPDEIAEGLGRHVLAIRPRLSELRRFGYVFVSNENEGQTIFGNSQACFTLTEKGKQLAETLD